MQDTTSLKMEQAAALLVAKAYTREWAEELLKAQSFSPHPSDASEWSVQVMNSEAGESEHHTDRQQVLEDHHREGIPPYEPPSR